MISGWGMQGVPGTEVRGEDLEALTKNASLTRGLGRSYGDTSLPAPGQLEIVASPLADRILSFDTSTGVLRTEAGFSFHELNRLFMPRGFFPPVTPGTSFVTVGGAVASDVHGKNHHVAGCFGEHVKSLKLQVPDGRIIEASPTNEPELFRATLGGLGLTGHILEVEFQLEKIPSPWIHYESERVDDIDAYITGLKDAAAGWPMTMGWIDCVRTGKHMGRGILLKGRWATAEEAPKTFPPAKKKLAVPLMAPSWAINPLTIRAFNWLYFWKHLPKKKSGLMHPDSFFYPLDAILHWNRIYGRKGFTQYQCVLPEKAGATAVREFLQLLTKEGGASFLCVIKDCGKEGTGTLSFPLEGTSIAVDMSVRKGTQKVVDALNAFVISRGGRIYLTKDAFTRPEDFRKMEPRLDEFLAVRRKWDPEGKLKSAQSVRVFGDKP
jgi:FAD/FMN-containing dehydrogenase